MITEEMKSTLLDIEINNPEGIQNLKALLKNYSDIIQYSRRRLLRAFPCYISYRRIKPISQISKANIKP